MRIVAQAKLPYNFTGGIYHTARPFIAITCQRFTKPTWGSKHLLLTGALKVEAPVVRAKKLKTKQWAGLSALKGCTITAVLSAVQFFPRGIYISYGQWL